MFTGPVDINEMPRYRHNGHTSLFKYVMILCDSSFFIRTSFVLGPNMIRLRVLQSRLLYYKLPRNIHHGHSHVHR